MNEAKIALGERGPVWWTDGAPDLNRRMARTTSYAAWYRAIEDRAVRHPKGGDPEPPKDFASC
jgi:hypothetical protein